MVRMVLQSVRRQPFFGGYWTANQVEEFVSIFLKKYATVFRANNKDIDFGYPFALTFHNIFQDVALYLLLGRAYHRQLFANC